MLDDSLFGIGEGDDLFNGIEQKLKKKAILNRLLILVKSK